jgi:hypothetical protein
MPDKKEQPRTFDHVLPEETRAHLRAARHEMRKGFEALMPPGFVQHHRAARKEILLAAREFINHAIESIESAG